ncbi:MAG: 3-methyl-2-oxobutanoate dehydrogenase subunit beta, partial [Saccharofermentans sp.]|nr:3-methyl-2-oxobutanoate dehydrogenase subunit beta [Saccharofermentans sp.]
SANKVGYGSSAGGCLAVVASNILRAGPGLGGILPAQSDYFQAVKGGGHGDYKNIVIAPASVQELYEMTVEAFNLADKYRMLAMIMGDGTLGQMMEPVAFRDVEPIEKIEKPWAAVGRGGREEHNMVTSIYINPDDLEAKNKELSEKYAYIEENEVRYEEIGTDDAEIVIVAYSTCSRICKNVIKQAAEMGIKVGMIRPITLWPFPSKVISEVADKPNVKAFLDVELSSGQMVEDVRLAVLGKKPVHFYGRNGGNLPTQKEILEQIIKIREGGNV